MYNVEIVLEGIADFLFNPMTEADREKFAAGTTGGDATDEARDKAAEKRVYVDEAGLYLPGWTFKRVGMDGAQTANLKLNKKGLRYRLAAVMFVQGTARFERNGAAIIERDYLSKVMGRQPPKKGAATIVRRPALSTGWQLRAQIVVLDDGVPPEAIQKSYEAAGLYVGVGAWRPEYGRFIVRSFEVSTEQNPAQSPATPSQGKRGKR